MRFTDRGACERLKNTSTAKHELGSMTIWGLFALVRRTVASQACSQDSVSKILSPTRMRSLFVFAIFLCVISASFLAASAQGDGLSGGTHLADIPPFSPLVLSFSLLLVVHQHLERSPPSWGLQSQLHYLYFLSIPSLSLYLNHSLSLSIVYSSFVQCFSIQPHSWMRRYHFHSQLLISFYSLSKSS